MNMRNQWYYLLLMAWISYLLASSLLLYTDGFFLHRVVRTERANCKLSRNYKPEQIFEEREENEILCLPSSRRVVVLIVDALKYEFVQWHENVAINLTYHLNKIPVIRKLSQSRPNNTRLFRFLADPPTTTMQRIKALTTGTLPTFIDAGSNFAAASIDEDNIIQQMAERSGVVFMGDDTWMQLFPEAFLRRFPSPSFDVGDLDTVDRQVRDRIAFEMEKKDWSLLIAHILGVDHCGHKYGPYHPEMARKLSDTNSLISQIVNGLDNDTMLFVMGDHGMTESGDHGGESDDEIQAALFVYSESPLFGTHVHGDSVDQIDLVPTIASILGIPVPFSNIGTLVPECLPRGTETIKQGDRDVPWFIVYSVWQNVIQMRKYVTAYSRDTFLFSDECLQDLEELFDKARKDAKSISDPESFENFVQSARMYSKTVRKLCAEVWIKFDPGLMSKGLIVFFSVLFFVYILLNALDEALMHNIMNSSFLSVMLVSNAVTTFAIYLFAKLAFLQEFKNTNFFANGILSVVLLAVLVIQNWDSISSTWYYGAKNGRVNYIERGIFLLTFCGLFSNSYIVEEDKIMLFLLVATVVLMVYKTMGDGNCHVVSTECERKWKSKRKLVSSRTLLYLVLILGLFACTAARISSYLWRCREEQDKKMCIILAGKTYTSDYQGADRALLVVSVVTLAGYVAIVSNWLRNTERLSEFLPTTNIVRYCYGIIAVTIGSYWVYERLPKDIKRKVVISGQVDALPGIAYFFASLGILAVYCRPLGASLFLRINKSTEAVPEDDKRAARIFFNKPRGVFCPSTKSTGESEFIVVSGSSTLYSSAFVSLSVFFTLLWALVLGNVFALGAFAMFVTCTAVLGIVAMERLRNANNIAALLQVPSSTILCWFLIAEYFFYATGHQTTFPTIHWNAAFVGTGGNLYGIVLPVILVGLNTFGSYLIMGISLPLLAIVPFTVYTMIPAMANLGCYVDEPMRRSEFVLTERSKSFHSALFSVYGKYILLHGLRAFGCMLTTTIHCRHLMAWKIFAPKLIFQGLSFFVTLGSILASAIMIQIIDRQVQEIKLRGPVKAR